MPKSLRQNLTSGYLDAARRLSPRQKRRRIVAYVESYDDIAFWRSLLSEFENEERYFQVMLPSRKSLAKGKKMVLTNLLHPDQLGDSMIACVDSDYDFLLQGATELSADINRNPSILQTYTYAIENYQCHAEGLHDICVQATLNDRQLLDFPLFMRQYSQVVYPLFLWNIFFYRRRDSNSFPMHDFHDCVRLTQELDVHHPEQLLDDVQRRVDKRLKRMQKRFASFAGQVKVMGRELESLGLTPETAYLYMQGHHIMDNVVMKLIVPVCNQLRREREADIKRLGKGRWEHMQNELACYENSIVPPTVMLRKNDNYKSLYLYDWMRRDVEQFLQQEKAKQHI
ncbi:MAG: DUF4435 domain-containing protein [Bacteroides sp.]|nr:DUF4435 domain-containing protein [Bacteroides sp.]